MAEDTMKLVIIRHGESEWNLKNLFTGWTDVDLTDTGRAEAAAGGKALKEQGYDFDVCYTSLLKRAIHTLNIVLDQMDRAWLPVHKTWRLNEPPPSTARSRSSSGVAPSTSSRPR